MIASSASLATTAVAPATASDTTQLQMFQSWAHSPTTAVIMAVAFAVLALLVFTRLGPRLFKRTASDTTRAAVVVLGVLGVVSWVTAVWWFTTLMVVLLWACLAWLIVRGLGGAVSGAARLATNLDFGKRAELQREQAAAAERGAALERVLDEAEEDRQ